MLIIDYLLSYILLLIALHFMYLFYILSFTFNSINMYSGSTDLKTKESLWEASFTIKLVSFI